MAGYIHNWEFCRPHQHLCWLTADNHANRHYLYTNRWRSGYDDITTTINLEVRIGTYAK